MNNNIAKSISYVLNLSIRLPIALYIIENQTYDYQDSRNSYRVSPHGFHGPRTAASTLLVELEEVSLGHHFGRLFDYRESESPNWSVRIGWKSEENGTCSTMFYQPPLKPSALPTRTTVDKENSAQ